MADDNQGDTLDVAALTAAPSFSTTAPTPNISALSPTQQRVVNQMQQSPNMQPIFSPTGEINTNSPVGAALSKFITTNSLDTAAVMQQQQALTGATNTAIAGANEAATASATITSLKEASARRVQAMDAADRAMFGIEGDGGASTIAGLSNAYRTNETTRQLLSKEIEKSLAIRFDEDPLGWLMKQFTLPGDIQQLAASERNVAQNLEVMKEIDALMSSRHKDNELAAADHSITMETAERALIFGQAKTDLAKILQTAAQNNISLLNIRNANTKAEFQAVLAANEQNMQTTTNSLKFAELSRQDDIDARQKALADLEIQQRTMQMGDMQQKIDAKNSMQQKLNQTGTVFGLSPPSVDLYNQMTDSKMKAFWTMGMADPNVQAGRYGKDIVDALKMIDMVPVRPPPGIAILQEKLNEVQAKVITDTGAFTWKELPEEVKHQKLLDGFKTYLNSEMKLVSPSGGIFSPGTLSSVMSIPAVASTVLSKELKGISMMPDHPLNPQESAASALLAVEQGKLSMSQASAELALIYRSAALDTNQKYNFLRMGFSGINNASGYNMSVQLGGSFSGRATINTMDAGSWYDALVKMKVRSQLQQDMTAPMMPGGL